ncbi:hypothetical protein C2E21_5409 [Chlorella sorokiniana]|uniref:Sulfotransferase n=1 Tax=Chlorella sorokiniana TaxID=3076 RepID=A0A2P6TNY4_CHLSO|nr:hypothetical protein C2E21_5409 [Chlorella sorokiniana]|eukprot:PRW51019.1 hypothetical protein C2E21_5409 [Chlorella sorokiniana]
MLARQLSLTDGLGTPRHRRPAGGGASGHQAQAPPLSRAASLAATVTITATAVGPKDARRATQRTSRKPQLVALAAGALLLLLVLFGGSSGWREAAFERQPAQPGEGSVRRHRKLDQPPPQPLMVQGLSLEVVPVVTQQAQQAQEQQQQAAPREQQQQAAPQEQQQQKNEQQVQMSQLDVAPVAQQQQQQQQQQQELEHQAQMAAADVAPIVQQQQQQQQLIQQAAAAGATQEWAEGGEDDSIWREGVPSPYQAALQRCADVEPSLACLKEAARQKRYRGQYLFPHFMIVGWQKCATTSLFHNLKDHPGIAIPVEKEPEYFSDECGYDPLSCPPDSQRKYIQETLFLPRVLRHGLYRAMFEGSTHYGREGAKLAHGLRQAFPWLKLVASLREPISRFLSMLGHNVDKSNYNCLVKHDLFDCLARELPWNNYTAPIAAWLEAFPADQLKLVQYESLTSPEHEADDLRAVKSFLGLDPDEPRSQLPQSNKRAARLGQEPEGWKLRRWQYERLIEVVRPDAARIAALVQQHGWGDGGQWLANWEAVWQVNLDGCGPGPEGECLIS